jgi:hypothetical protein
MKYLLFALISLYASFSQPLFAEDKLSLPDTEVTVRTHDGNELSLYQYPAQGDTLVLWIGGSGWHDRSTQLAMDFARQGIEVWQIDFAEALMQTSGSSFLRNLDANYVADVIDAAHQRSGKRVVLFAQLCRDSRPERGNIMATTRKASGKAARCGAVFARSIHRFAGAGQRPGIPAHCPRDEYSADDLSGQPARPRAAILAPAKRTRAQ